MTEETRRSTGSIARGPLIAGLVLLFLGVASLFERWAWFGWGDLWRFWPLVLIGLGVAVMTTAREREGRERRSGVFLVLLGVWMLINSLELFGLHWGTSWPLIFVVIGVTKMIEAGRLVARGLVFVAAGAWLTIAQLGLWGLDIRSSWPFALVLFGLYLVATAFWPDRDGDDERSRP